MSPEEQCTPSMPLWIASRAVLHGKADAFFRYTRKVLKKFDPEDIHDLRVSSRRLREAFALFAPCYAAADVKRCVRKVKEVTGALGKIRNDDEARLFFSGLLQETEGKGGAETAELAASFERRRQKELKKLGETLETILPAGCRNDFRDVIETPVLFAPSPGPVNLLASVAEFGKTAFEKHLALIGALVPHACRKESHDTQHLLRIALKHFRYRMECLSFLLEPEFSALHSVVKEYQDVLGKLHDMDVFAVMAWKADLSEETRHYLVDRIAARRGEYFSTFGSLMETSPLLSVCGRVQEIA